MRLMLPIGKMLLTVSMARNAPDSPVIRIQFIQRTRRQRTGCRREGILGVTGILCGIILTQTVGCGFTNDSIPDGRSVIKGRVVRAANPTVSVANATVTITTTPPNSGTLNYIVISGADGGFEVDGIQTGPINSNVTVAVMPNDASVQSQRFSFLLTNNQGTYVVAALPPASLALSQASGVVLTPLSGGPANSAVLSAQVVNASGNSLGIIPSMIFDDGVAVINSDGTFTINGASSATVTANVTATIDTGAANPPVAMVKVTVGPASSGTAGQSTAVNARASR